MKSAVVVLLSVFSAVATAAAAESNPPPDVVPALRQWTGGTGMFAAKSADIVVDEACREKLAGTAAQFAADLKETGLGTHAVRFAAAPQAGHFFLTAARDPKLDPEGYKLEMADSAILRADTAAGMFYATRTVLQILAQDRAACTLPKGAATDFPAYRHRMFMLDVGRKPFPIGTLNDFIRVMGWYKMNELHLHFSDEAFSELYSGFRLQCDTFPGLTSKDLFYTKQEIRQLQDFAKARGITITPEIDMPGHALCFTNYWPELRHPKLGKTYLDVTNPKTVERMKKLLDEMIPLFDAPDFHIGTDEYRLGGVPEADKQKLGEAFRQFINVMNAHVRSRGKNCRIWSGWDQMPGTTVPDPTVTIDMWLGGDAKSLTDQGHRVINSLDGLTYLVPGCHYYGVNNAGIYQNWEPWKINGNPARCPAPDSPLLLGGKLHLWNDMGPTGYTYTEIAELALPSLQVFSEKLWGVKGSPDHPAFQKRAARTLPVPGVTMFDRIPEAARPGAVVLDLPGERTLADANASIPLPLAKAARPDLEFPWTLTVELRKSAASAKRGVILSSALAEICTDFQRDGHRGVGVLRSAGGVGRGPQAAADPVANSNLGKDVNRVYGEPIPANQWTSLTVVGARGRTTVYVNGVKAGESNDQMLCPLAMLGGTTGNSFAGTLRNLKVYARALSAKEIGRAAGLDVPDDLAAGRPASASASDAAHGLTPEKLTDGDPATRWSSGMTRQPQWAAVDLGAEKSVGRVVLNWEAAFAKSYAVEVSSDGQAWKEVFRGEGKAGETRAEFAPVKARHVRIRMPEAANEWGYSLWSIEVFPPATPKK